MVYNKEYMRDYMRRVRHKRGQPALAERVAILRAYRDYKAGHITLQDFTREAERIHKEYMEV